MLQTTDGNSWEHTVTNEAVKQIIRYLTGEYKPLLESLVGGSRCHQGVPTADNFRLDKLRDMIRHEHVVLCGRFIVRCCLFLTFGEQLGLCKRPGDPSGYFFTDGIRAGQEYFVLKYICT